MPPLMVTPRRRQNPIRPNGLFLLYVLCTVLVFLYLFTSQSFLDKSCTQIKKNENPYLILGVFSTATEREWRNVHRQTHFNYANVCNGQSPKEDCSILGRFVLGLPVDNKMLLDIQKENDTYGDIILLDIEENMNTGKTYAWWKYASTHFPDANYFSKSDSDTYIWTQRLENSLKSIHDRYVYYGRVSCGHRIGCQGNQRFISGGFQVLSSDLVHWIADPGNFFVYDRRIGYEDLITGEWLHVGHRTVHMHSPCPDEIEDMHHIYNNQSCGHVFRHWIKNKDDFRKLWAQQEIT